MSREARFRITGTVKKVLDRGKMAVVVVAAEGVKRSIEHDLKCFDVALASKVETGGRYTFSGDVEREKLWKTVRKSDDGREFDVWAPMLVLHEVKQAGEVAKAPGERRPPPPREPPPPKRPHPDPVPEGDDADDIPF